jgi:NAD(P)-dependent dehydrogenase (short-subunit alcohol dehydrogenase family)
MTWAWVTGASRGIGRATALQLAQRGTDLLLLGRRSAALEELLHQVAETGVRANFVEANLVDAEVLAQACREQLEQCGVPDVLVNNAGVIERQSVEKLSLESWDRQMAVNLRTPFLITRELLPSMRARRQGRLIHVGSISSTLGAAQASAYCASKWGLVGFMKSLAEELQDSGVMTLAILPGSVDTDMLQGSGFAPRMSADDVARTIVYYALDAPVAHNGSVIEMFGV